MSDILNAKVAAFSSLLADIPAPASQPSFCCTAQRSSCCARTRTSHLATAKAPRGWNSGTSPLVALVVVSIVLVLQGGRKKNESAAPDVKIFYYHESPPGNCERVVDAGLPFWETYVADHALPFTYSMTASSSDVPSYPVVLQ